MCHISSHAKPLESLCSYSMMPTCPWPQHLRLLYHRPFLWQLSRMEALGVVFRMDSVSALPSHFLPRDSAFSWEGNLCGGWRESGMVRNCSSQNHSKSVMVRVFTFFFSTPVNCNHDWNKGYLCLFTTGHFLSTQ